MYIEKQPHGGKLKRRDQLTGMVPLSKEPSAATQHGTVVRVSGPGWKRISLSS